MTPARPWLIALLLPVLALRALLPAGFMPVAEASGFRIVLCSAGLQSGDASSSGGVGWPNDNDCPFAQGLASGPPSVPLALALAARELRLPAEAPEAQQCCGPGPQRVHSARAPPLSAIA